jgi:hypothetical protein
MYKPILRNHTDDMQTITAKNREQSLQSMKLLNTHFGLVSLIECLEMYIFLAYPNVSLCDECNKVSGT